MGLDQFTLFLVRFGIGLGVLDHLVDIRVGQTARSLDADRLFLAGRLVLGGHVDDTVGVDVEGDLDLRNATRRRRNTFQVELTQFLVVCSHLALALGDADGHGVLIIVGRGEDLGLLGRDGRVALDQAGEDTTQRLDAQRQRGHVEKQDVFHVTLQDAGLDGGTHGNHFIRVHTLVRILAEEGLHGFLDFRHAGHAADQDHVVNVRCGQAGIFQGFLARLQRALDQVLDQGFQLGAGELDVEVFRAGCVRGDEGQVHFIGGCRRQLFLGFLCFFLEALKGQLVGLQVNAVLFLELVREVFNDTQVEVLTTQEGVAIGGLHFEDTIADFQDRDVERTAAEVEDSNRLAVILFQAIGQRRCGRLVDDTEHFQTGDLAGVLGRLTLGVIEIGRDRDDSLVDTLAEIAFSGLFHLLQDEGGDFGRRVFLVAALDPCRIIVGRDDLVRHHAGVFLDRRIVHVAADQALDGEEGLFRVGDSLATRRLTDQALAVFGEGHEGRRRAHAFGVFDDFGLTALHHCDTGIGGTKVDADDLTHIFSPYSRRNCPGRA